MGGGPDRGRVYFCCDEEGYGVGAELVEEGGEEVHCLETGDVGFASEVAIVKGGDDEEDKVHEEAD